MHSQHTSSGEAVSATLIRAGEVLHLLMNALDVIFQMTIRSKLLRTLLTLKALLVLVSYLVSFERSLVLERMRTVWELASKNYLALSLNISYLKPLN